MFHSFLSSFFLANLLNTEVSDKSSDVGDISIGFLIAIIVGAIILGILLLWFACYLVRRGILTDSPLLIIVGIWLGSIWIPLIYYFIVKDKYKKIAEEKKKTEELEK